MVGTRLVIALAVVAGCRETEDEAPPAKPQDVPLAWPAVDEQALVAAIQTRTPAIVAVAPDGAVVVRSASGAIEQIDAAGKRTELPIPADARATIELSDDGLHILAAGIAHALVIDRPDHAIHDLGALVDAHLSPDGSRVGFVRDDDVWITAVTAPKPARVTNHPAGRGYGVIDPSSRALGRDRGWWWSPDGKSIAFQRTDASAVEMLYAADPSHPERPAVATRDPRPGKPIATVDLGVVASTGGSPRWITWDLARYPYLATVQWHANEPLTLVVMSRTQSELAALAVDAGTWTTRVLVVDKDAAWLEAPPDLLTWLPDHTRFVWRTESHGAWSLDVHDGDRVQPLVTPDVGLRRVVGIIGPDLVIEAASDPREQHIWKVPHAGGTPVALTSNGGIHRAMLAGTTIAIASENRTGPPDIAIIRGGDHTNVRGSDAAAATTTTIESIAIEDHAQFVAITRPRVFDPKVRYPVLVIADPMTTTVVDVHDAYRIDQWYADAGFIVVRTDGRGTPDRGRDWQRAIAGDVLTLPMNDQIGALKKAGNAHPELDTARTGVIGGYFAVMAVMLHPETFAAAVATTPVVDWERVNAARAERWMKTPATNAEGYRRTNAITYAQQLARPLLIIDDPSSRSGTAALVEALFIAGKHAAIAAIPDEPGPDLAVAIARHKLQLEMLRDRLGPPIRPAVMPKVRTEEDEEREEREHH